MSMSLLYILAAFACAVALVSIGTIAAAVTRRWTQTRTMARVTTYGALALLTLLPICIVMSLVFGIADADASSKAARLARAIADAMNCGALALPALLIGPTCWWLSSRNLKRIAGVQ